MAISALMEGICNIPKKGSLSMSSDQTSVQTYHKSTRLTTES